MVLAFVPKAVADPAFPVGGVVLGGGAWTSGLVTFRKFCMSKRKNLDPLGGRAPGTPPLDPPMKSNDSYDIYSCTLLRTAGFVAKAWRFGAYLSAIVGFKYANISRSRTCSGQILSSLDHITGNSITDRR